MEEQLKAEADKRGWPCPRLTQLVEDRETIITGLMTASHLDRAEAKKTLQVILYGGGPEDDRLFGPVNHLLSLRYELNMIASRVEHEKLKEKYMRLKNRYNDMLETIKELATNTSMSDDED